MIKSNHNEPSNINLSLNTKIIMITLFGIVIATLLVVIVTINTGQVLYMETYSKTNIKVMNWISEELEDLNYKAVNLINEYSRNNLMREFLTNEFDVGDKRFYNKYRLNTTFLRINAKYGMPLFNIYIAGENGNVYSNNYIGVTSETFHKVQGLDIFNENQEVEYGYRTKGINGYASQTPSVIITHSLKDSMTNKNMGRLVISIKEKQFRSVYDKYLFRGNNALIIGKEGQVLSSSIEKYVGKRRLDILSIAKKSLGTVDSKSVTIDDNNYLLMSRYFPSLDAYLIMLDDNSVVAKAYSETRFTVTVIAITVALLTCFFLALIIGRVTSPLRNMIKTMEVASDSNFVQKVDVEGGYEVRMLGQAYNQMVDTLESYIERLIDEQEQRRAAELSSLQMQINPHFMYNTLTSIKFLAKQGNIVAVDEMINAFIGLLQNTISKTDEMVTLKDEIDNLKNYAKINSIRYGDKIKAYFYIDDRALDIMVPKLILQPIIENAFFHAFSNKTMGEIRVFVSILGDRLICEVIDNGDGMKGDVPTKQSGFKKFSKGIGLGNISERLKLVYGNDAFIQIQSTPNVGTTVKITIENVKVNYYQLSENKY